MRNPIRAVKLRLWRTKPCICKLFLGAAGLAPMRVLCHICKPRSLNIPYHIIRGAGSAFCLLAMDCWLYGTSTVHLYEYFHRQQDGPRVLKRERIKDELKDDWDNSPGGTGICWKEAFMMVIELLIVTVPNSIQWSVEYASSTRGSFCWRAP